MGINKMTSYIAPQTRSWLAALPPGEYKLTDVMTITGVQDKSKICRLFKRLKVPKRYGKQTNHNFVEVIYIWQGLPELQVS